MRKALHGVALPVALQLQLLPLPRVLRVRLDLRRRLVWKRGEEQRGECLKPQILPLALQILPLEL